MKPESGGSVDDGRDVVGVAPQADPLGDIDQLPLGVVQGLAFCTGDLVLVLRVGQHLAAEDAVKCIWQERNFHPLPV